MKTNTTASVVHIYIHVGSRARVRLDGESYCHSYYSPIMNFTILGFLNLPGAARQTKNLFLFTKYIKYER